MHTNDPYMTPILDFNLRKRNRKTFPGACSLEYESAMQITLECLFGWDPTNQMGKRGILGVLEAFCRASEEQGNNYFEFATYYFYCSSELM